MKFRRKFEDSIIVTSSIGHLITPLLYPSKSVKCVMTDSNHRMTRNALTLLENLDIEHPVGLYVYDVCRSFVDQYKTGGTYLLYFIASWTKAAELITDMGIPSSDVINLLDTVIERVIQHTDTLKFRVTDVLECEEMFPPSKLPDTNDTKLTASAPGTIIKLYEKQSNKGINNVTVKGTFEQKNQTVIPKIDDEILTNFEQTTEVYRNNTLESETGNNRHASATVPSKSMTSDLKMKEDNSISDIEHSFNDVNPALLVKTKEFSVKGLQETCDLFKRDGMYNAADEKDEFIDGVNIVQLKMENVSQEEDLDEDLSWFFQVNNREDSKGNVSQRDTTKISNKSKDPKCAMHKHGELLDLVRYEEMSNKINNISGICSNLSSEKSTDADVNNLNGTSDTDVNLENELVTLKAGIEMDIRTIKQRQEQFNKIKKFSVQKPDPPFEQAEDEFDSSFDDSIPINALQSMIASAFDDISAMEDEFKTINFYFRKENSKVSPQVITMELETTHTSCQTLQTESKHNTQHTPCISRAGSLELCTTSKSLRNPESTHDQEIGGHFTKQNDIEIFQIDEFETDFDTRDHSIKLSSNAIVKDVHCAANVKHTSKTKSAYSTQKTTGTKLQEIDNILKGLGQDLKQSSVKAKTMLMSSRHLAEWNSKDTSDAVSVESSITSTLSNTKSNKTENKKVSVDLCEETKDYMTENKQIVKTDHSVDNETKVPKRLTSASPDVIKTESLGLGNMNELLNNILNVNTSLSDKEKKSKFQSGIFLRSRHLQSNQDEKEEEEDVHNEQASGQSTGNPGDADVRRKLLQLVKCLNYGTDHRILNVITDIVIKHSQENNLCILPQYVQTYCITGGQRDPELVNGIVIQTSHSQLTTVHSLHGKPCRLLIVNADIKSSYKHKGYKPMKTTRILTAETFADHVTKRDQWTIDVTDVLKTLNLDMVLARGCIAEDFKHMCDAHGVFTMEFVPYKQLSLISEAAKVTMVTYITLATEDNVCQQVFVSPLEMEINQAEDEYSTGPSHHAAVVTIATNNPQTVILKNHSETLVRLEEEEFWDCLNRTSSALHTGFLLPGAGQVECACANFCSEMRDKYLKDSCHQQNPEEFYSLLYVYDIFAQTFSEYARLVQEHFTLVEDMKIDCVFDDYRTKVCGWKSALDTVSTIKCSDFFISTGITEENQQPHDFVL